MKTNIKNGLFAIGFIPVDTASIKLTDTHTGEGLKFETGADGQYTVMAETNEKGIVTGLIIDFPEHAIWSADSEDIEEIDENMICIVDGEVYELEPEKQ